MELSGLTTGGKAMATLALISRHGYGGNDGPYNAVRGISGSENLQDNFWISPGITSIEPGYGWGQFYGTPILYFNGHQPEILAHTGGLLAQWGDESIQRTRGYVKQWWDRAQEILDQFLTFAGPLDSSNVIFAGHSLGGVFALMTAVAWRLRAGTAKQEVFTFGAPSSIYGIENAAWIASHTSHWRYIRTGDVVPQLPPAPDESWTALALSNWTRRWGSITHDVRAINLEESSSYQWYTTPQAGEVGINVRAWLTETMTNSPRTHSHFVYWPLVFERYSEHPLQTVGNYSGDGRGRRQPDPPAAFIMPVELIQKIRYVQSEYNEQAQVHGSKSYPRSFSVGRTPVGYEVLYHGLTSVAAFAKKRSARKLAATLNATEKQLGRANSITQSELGLAIQDVAATIVGIWNDE